MIHLKTLENKLHSKIDMFAEMLRDKKRELEDDDNVHSVSVFKNLSSSGAIMMVTGFAISVSNYCIYLRTGSSFALENSNLATRFGLLGFALYAGGSVNNIGNFFHKRPTIN